METFAGGRFMEAFNGWYYSFSPAVAKALYADEGLRAIARAALMPLIASLEASSAAYPAVAAWSRELAVALVGLIASSLIGAIYLGPALSLMALKRPGRAWRRAALMALLALISSAGLMALAELPGLQGLMAASASAFVVSAISASAFGVAIAATGLAGMAKRGPGRS